MHQLEAEVRFLDGVVNYVKRDVDGLFPCLCGRRRFVYPHSLQRHAKQCVGQGSITSPTEETTSTTEPNSEVDEMIPSNSMEEEGRASILHDL